MPNYIDQGDFSKGERQRSSRSGAVRAKQRESPVFCGHEYEDAPDEEALCGNRAIRHTNPPRCTQHGGVHADFSRKRTEAGYVRVNPKMAALLRGDVDISELDDEELARGQFRNSAGKFTGRGTEMVPRAMYTKMMNELFKRANEQMKTSLVDAVNVLTAIATDPDADPKDAMKAAQWLVERVMGKTPENVIIKQDKPWQSLLVNVTSDNPKDYEDFVKEEATSDDDRF